MVGPRRRFVGLHRIGQTAASRGGLSPGSVLLLSAPSIAARNSRLKLRRLDGGLVLTSSAEVPFRMPLPSGYRWLPLRHLLDAEGGELQVQRSDPARPCRRSRQGRHSATTGRPGVKSLVLDEFHRRGRVSEIKPTLRAEASVLRSWLVASHPHAGSRSLAPSRTSSDPLTRRGASKSTTHEIAQFRGPFFVGGECTTFFGEPGRDPATGDTRWRTPPLPLLPSSRWRCP